MKKNFVSGYCLYNMSTRNLLNSNIYPSDKDAIFVKKGLPEAERNNIFVLPFKQRLPKKYRVSPAPQLELFEKEVKAQNLDGLLN